MSKARIHPEGHSHDYYIECPDCGRVGDCVGSFVAQKIADSHVCPVTPDTDPKGILAERACPTCGKGFNADCFDPYHGWGQDPKETLSSRIEDAEAIPLGAWQKRSWAFYILMPDLIAAYRAQEKELGRLRKGMTLEELLAHHGLPTPDVTNNDRAEFRVESVVAALAERDSLRARRYKGEALDSRGRITQLQAENAKLIAWQQAAAEERIVLRERLNEIELGFRHWRDSDWVDSDMLRVALTESQEEPHDAQR